MMSISEVKVSQDLRNADIFISFYNKEDSFDSKDYLKIIKSKANLLKFKISSSLNMKYMPKIKFFLSDDYEYYDRINRILKND